MQQPCLDVNAFICVHIWQYSCTLYYPLNCCLLLLGIVVMLLSLFVYHHYYYCNGIIGGATIYRSAAVGSDDVIE